MEEKEKKIIDYFNILKEYSLLGHTYLFIGENQELLFLIAKLINCSQPSYFCNVCDDCLKIERKLHPDVYLLSPPNRSITIADIRSTQKFLSLKPFQGKYKILLITSAHYLTEEAANAFLKTLEEPPPHSFIALITSRMDLLLPTILSRCKKIYLPHSQSPQYHLRDNVLDFINKGELDIKDRDQLVNSLSQLIYFLRDFIVYSLYKDRNMLINPYNYEIILNRSSHISIDNDKLSNLLKIFEAIDNININLATNLIKLNFS